MRKGKIAIVFPRPYLDTVPGIFGAVTQFSKHGYGVDVFASVDSRHRVPVFDDPEVKLKVLRMETVLPDVERVAEELPDLVHVRPYEYLKARKPPIIWPVLRTIYRGLREGTHVGTRLAGRLSGLLRSVRIRLQHFLSPYRCFIGVEPAGLVQAVPFAQALNVPFAYYSLELLLSDELTSDHDKQLKGQEVALSRQAAFVIIQDEERGRLLAEDNGLPIEKFVFVPNAPEGPARRAPSGYWHREFELAPETRVVLHTGGLGAWTGAEEIAKSVSSWPDNWVLVIHTRRDDSSHVYGESLRGLATPGRVFLSLKPVSRQDYDPLVDGADIGIAFYVRVPGSPYTQRNIEAIGLSSGKIAYCLRAGVPVIVNRTPSISGLVEREGCGVAVEDAGSIGAAIAKIEANYDDYSKNACRAFERYFDFAGHFEDVIKRIDALQGPSEVAASAAVDSVPNDRRVVR